MSVFTKLMNSLSSLSFYRTIPNSWPVVPSLLQGPLATPKKPWDGAAGAGVLSQQSRDGALRSLVPTTLMPLLQSVTLGLCQDQQWQWECFRSQRHCAPSCCSEMMGPDYCCEGLRPLQEGWEHSNAGDRPSSRVLVRLSGGVVRKPCSCADQTNQRVQGT